MNGYLHHADDSVAAIPALIFEVDTDATKISYTGP